MSTGWYARTVFPVEDIPTALTFYCTQLDFELDWSHAEEERPLVAQVCKGDFELILATNLPRIGCGRSFISLEQPELERLEQNLRTRTIEHSRIHWGYPTILVRDPDGNELLFPLTDGK